MEADSQRVIRGDVLGLLRLSLQSLQQHRRSDAHVRGAALQVGQATLLGLELPATDGTVGDNGRRRRRGWSAIFTVIQAPVEGDHSLAVNQLFSAHERIFESTPTTSMSKPVEVLRSPLGCHMRQSSVADLTEEEASALQVCRPGLRRLPVQLLLQTQGQSLVAVPGLRVEA